MEGSIPNTHVTPVDELLGLQQDSSKLYKT